MGIIDDKWELIFEKYEIHREIERNGLFYITAESIREFKRIDKENFLFGLTYFRSTNKLARR